MFNSFNWRVDIVLTKNGIHTLTDIIIVDPTQANLFHDLSQLKDLLPMMEPKKGVNTPLINSSL
jgi:hypothetical protein